MENIMKLDDLYGQYKNNLLGKTEYIDLMHEKHKVLFDYHDYINSTDVASITIERDRIYLTIQESGIKLLLDPLDKRFIPIEILNFKSIEPLEKNLIINLVSHCKVVVDVGANIGWYTLNLGKLKNVEKIYAFEPIPHTYSYLVEHIKMNEILVAETHNVGLSNEVGEKNFYWTTEETGSSSMSNIRERNDISLTRCRVDTLDNFMKNKESKIDFIKIDVEGAELLVIEGAIKCIDKDHPIIFAELLRKWSAKFNYHPNDVIELLKKKGYKVFIASHSGMSEISKIDTDTVDTNFFFLHAVKHLAFIEQFAR